jgi:hypothetical protein
MIIGDIKGPRTGADDIVGCEDEGMPDCLYVSPRLASETSLEDLDGRIGPNFVGISLCRYTVVVDEEGELLAVLWVNPSVDRMKVQIGQMGRSVLDGYLGDFACVGVQQLDGISRKLGDPVLVEDVKSWSPSSPSLDARAWKVADPALPMDPLVCKILYSKLASFVVEVQSLAHPRKLRVRLSDGSSRGSSWSLTE